MKLILGPNSQQQDEQWAKEQEDQIENAEMYNVEKALPQVPNSLPHNSENFEESKTKGTTEKNKKKDKNCMLFWADITWYTLRCNLRFNFVL